MIENEKLADLAEFLFTLVSIESPPGNEIAAVKYVVNTFREIGYKADVQFLHQLSFNIIINNVKNPDLLIATHIDTVPPICEARLTGTYKIKGTGSVDAKGSIAAIYYLLKQIETLPRNVSIAIFSEEESSGGGALTYLLDHTPKNVLIMEPTNLKIANSATGYLELKLTVSGQHYHPDLVTCYDSDPSVPKKGIKLLAEIDNFLKRKNLTYSITKIRSDGSDYFIPASFKTEINIHIPPRIKPLDVYRSFIDEFKHVEELEIVIDDFSDPIEISEKSFLEKATRAYYEAFGKKPTWYTMPSWTDATSFVENGIPSLIFGPGDPSLAHNENEEIDVRDVALAGKFLFRLISQYT